MCAKKCFQYTCSNMPLTIVTCHSSQSKDVPNNIKGGIIPGLNMLETKCLSDHLTAPEILFLMTASAFGRTASDKFCNF